MLRILLLFTIISVISTQTNCPAYPAFSNFRNNNNNLKNVYNGTFLMTYTSAGAVNCHRIKYVIDANGVTTGQIKSPGCCVWMRNLVFNSDELDYTIGPLAGYQGNCPSLVDEPGSMKLLATSGSGESLCLIAALCQADYYGINVMCRGQPPLLIDILAILSTVTGLVGFSGTLQSVSQQNCDATINMYCPFPN